MGLILENGSALAISIVVVIAFAAFIASPYEIYFEDTDEIEEI